MPSVSARMRMPRAGLEPAVRFLARGLLIPCVFQFRHLGTIHERRALYLHGWARRSALPGQILGISIGFRRLLAELEGAPCDLRKPFRAGQDRSNDRERLLNPKIDALRDQFFAHFKRCYQPWIDLCPAVPLPDAPYLLCSSNDCSRTRSCCDRLKWGFGYASLSPNPPKDGV